MPRGPKRKRDNAESGRRYNLRKRRKLNDTAKMLTNEELDLFEEDHDPEFDSDYNPQSDSEQSDDPLEYDSEMEEDENNEMIIDNVNNSGNLNETFVVPDNIVEYEDGQIDTNYKEKRILSPELTNNIKKVSRNNSSLTWLKNLSIKEQEELIPIYKKILTEFKNRNIDEGDILKSKLSNEEKLECYELMRIMRNTREVHGETEDWLRQRLNLFKKIKKDQPLTKEDQAEIYRLKKLLGSELTLEQKIVRSKHPDKIKKQIYKKYMAIKNISEKDSEYMKVVEWINKCLDLPTEMIDLHELYDSSSSMLKIVKNKMDRELYGQNRAKERILEILSAMWTNQDRSRNCIVFLGNPGVGKTALARHLANAIRLPFYQISFGGATDSTIIKGHDFTYLGSKPGEIVEALIQMAIKNGILFLDELDKIVNSEKGREVSNALLHLLDYTQNSDFKDNYLHGIPIDVSKLIIIVSINNLKSINKVLRDRLPIVVFDDYTFEDKINIGCDFTVPRAASSLNLRSTDYKYDESSIAYIIKKSIIQEPGVRQMERNIFTVFERINTLKQIYMNKKSSDRLKLSYDIQNFKLPITLNKKVIDTLFEEQLCEDKFDY